MQCIQMDCFKCLSSLQLLFTLGCLAIMCDLQVNHLSRSSPVAHFGFGRNDFREQCSGVGDKLTNRGEKDEWTKRLK